MNKKKMQRLFNRYTAKRLRRRNFRFGVFYLFLLCAIVFGLYKLYVYVDDFLVAYEKAQSRHVIEDMADMFLEKRFEDIYEYENKELLQNETKEDYVAYLTQLTEGAYITYVEVPSQSSSERLFKVTANGKSFASFSIKNSGEFADCNLFGLIKDVELYVPGTVSTDILQPVTYQVVIPTHATLIINGEEAKEEYLIKSGEKTFASDHLPEGYPVYTLDTYRFTLSLGTPVISALDENGNALTLKEISQDCFEYTFNYKDEELSPLHESKAIDAAKAICKYMTKNTYQNDVLQYMHKNSEAAKNIREVDSHWTTKADKYSFENIETKNYIMFSDTVFSCEVSLDYLTTTRKVENTYPTAYRFYFSLEDGEWLIYYYENCDI